jgi:hypothetical protein
VPGGGLGCLCHSGVAPCSNSLHLGQASGHRRAPRPGHREFFPGTRIEEAQERPLPASGGAGEPPPPPKKTPPRPPGGTQGRGGHRGPGAGGWVAGAPGSRKGQLRVLGSPSALRTKEPRTGGPPATGGAGIPRTRYFFAKGESPKPLETHLGVLKPACG